MKIAYVFHEDAADPAIQSGRPTSLLTEFIRLGVDVERVFPLAAPSTGADLAKKVGYRLLGKFHRGDRNSEHLELLAAQIERRIAGVNPDLIFSAGSEAISHLRTKVPVAFCADATFANLVDYYWDFTGLSQEYLREGHAQEAATLRKSSLSVFPSEWAARAATGFYGADPATVAVISFGANLGSANQRASVQAWIGARPADCIRLLFVGRHWERKGGEVVIATALCLAAHGHAVTVDVVGCEVPAEHRDLLFLRQHGLLRQGNPTEMMKLTELYAQAHFLFVPSRAEAYGFTFAEANAFGVPAIATRTGGIPAVIRDGYNGMLLPLEARASDYADAIVATFADQGRYRAMCHRSFAEFEHRLNWRVFVRKFMGLAEERLGLRVASPAVATPLVPFAG